jgi:hypothetical protein
MNSEAKDPTRTTKWQKRLLPFMVSMIVILTFFFLAASFYQLYYLHQKIEDCPTLNLEPAMSLLDDPDVDLTQIDKFDLARWKTLATLEGYTLERRYHQANVFLMSRIWKKYLGFVTGMILALVGAVFILGKLREPTSTLDAETGIGKFSLTTASPGLLLALLGTILMITTIVTHKKIEVQDKPTYTHLWVAPYMVEQGDDTIDTDNVNNWAEEGEKDLKKAEEKKKK